MGTHILSVDKSFRPSSIAGFFLYCDVACSFFVKTCEERRVQGSQRKLNVDGGGLECRLFTCRFRLPFYACDVHCLANQGGVIVGMSLDEFDVLLTCFCRASRDWGPADFTCLLLALCLKVNAYHCSRKIEIEVMFSFFLD